MPASSVAIVSISSSFEYLVQSQAFHISIFPIFTSSVAK